MFRSIGAALAAAIGCCIALAAHVIEPILYAIASGCEAMACGVAKLTRELVHSHAQSHQLATGIGCGLSREGHGFRQTSASDLGAQRTPLSI
jgi:hypothetical protein